MPSVICPDCGGQVSVRAASCVHCGYSEGPPAPGASAVAHRTAGYLLEAATLLPLFRMTMPRAAWPSWTATLVLLGALVAGGALLHHLGARAGRRTLAAGWSIPARRGEGTAPPGAP
jgi:hypothetical protein